MTHSLDMIRRQYQSNLQGLAGMLAKAERTGRKVGGFTTEQLRERVAAFTRIVAMDDAALTAHLQDRSAIRRRLAELTTADGLKAVAAR